MLERSYFKILFFYSFHYKSCTCKKRRKLKISPQPHTFIMHTHFDSLHINSLRETAWNCCMHNKCMEFYGSFTKDKNNNNKKESSSKDHKLIFNQTLPTSNWKSSMTFKLYLFYLNIPGICTSQVSSFALFRFLDVLIGCREKNLSLGLPHCLTIKYFIKYAYH